MKSAKSISPLLPGESVADSYVVRTQERERGNSSGNLHILHGVIALDVGGLERIVLSLIREGHRRGHRISVVCIERPGTLATDAEAAGATVLSLDKPPGRIPAFVQSAARILEELKPDVVHTHQIGAASYLGRAARSWGRKLPLLHTEHGNEFARNPSRLKTLKTRMLFWQTARCIDSFCCVSNEIAAAAGRWNTVPAAKLHVVPNGIPTEDRTSLIDSLSIRTSLGIPEGAAVVGTVGRLTEVKRQDLLIRAVAKLSEKITGLHLVLVGDGEERSNLKALASQVGLKDRAHFAGYRANPQDFLQIFTVFALTSRSEGFPVSLLEAWIAGIPVVCSAVGGIPAVVESESTGLLFTPGNEEALVDSLHRLLENESLRIRLSDAGRKVVKERYSLNRMADDYEARYRQLLSARRGKS